ncbi:MAG: hypothetical protein MOIL_00724 [Candidatus Methanolliviera sp. GoM_oil]|nr:MAG: hypothetical protein MOIL_00724 [Candidatus Methanolliviera sp. GoM_oil]
MTEVKDKSDMHTEKPFNIEERMGSAHDFRRGMPKIEDFWDMQIEDLQLHRGFHYL